jgi:hypothetical protein
LLTIQQTQHHFQPFRLDLTPKLTKMSKKTSISSTGEPQAKKVKVAKEEDVSPSQRYIHAELQLLDQHVPPSMVKSLIETPAYCDVMKSPAVDNSILKIARHVMGSLSLNVIPGIYYHFVSAFFKTMESEDAFIEGDGGNCVVVDICTCCGNIAPIRGGNWSVRVAGMERQKWHFDQHCFTTISHIVTIYNAVRALNTHHKLSQFELGRTISTPELVAREQRKNILKSVISDALALNK